ncbi:MAG: DotU family type IV/VI secretion system protein [Gammaproteobacteria bacterium]|nr:DotU family type IV/VI secretion system protein [Gammaproteobacteria bacterium]
MDAASTLIAVFQKTRQSVSHPDVGGLHQRLTSEIRQFEKNLKTLQFKPEVILSARYCVCTVLDEAVLNTPWGSESGWSQRTLLSIFHNETAGGEKYFQILDRMKEYPAENIDILELLYVFLSLGFEGKFRVLQRGRDAIEQLRDELFRCIRMTRGEYERSLSPNWQGLGRVRKSMISYIPFWVVASVLGVVLVLSYSGLRFWLFETSTPVVAKLQQIVELKPANRN